MSKTATITRCAKCLLPSNYPGITFDNDHVCNYCTSNKDVQIDYLGIEKLKEDINEKLDKYPNRNKKYDCAVSFSGGRDSTYLVYILKNKLNLNVLALTLSHDFLPDETIENIQNITKKLGVDSVLIENEYLNKGSKFFVRSWAKKPSAPALVTFCTGCRYGLYKLIPEYCVKNNIPILFTGHTPYEATNYKIDIVNHNPENPTTLGLVRGYAKEILKNLNYLKSPKSLFLQVEELRTQNTEDEYWQKRGLQKMHPFLKYIEWKEEELNKVLDELEWIRNDKFTGEWRSDCYVNGIRQYFYRKALGFNDVDVYVSKTVRLGQVSPEEGLKQIEEIENIDDETMDSILKTYYNISLSDFKLKE